MAIPIKFENDPEFADVKKLYDKIDECPEDDLNTLEELRLDVQARLDDIFNRDKNLNNMVKLI